MLNFINISDLFHYWRSLDIDFVLTYETLSRYTDSSRTPGIGFKTGSKVKVGTPWRPCELQPTEINRGTSEKKVRALTSEGGKWECGERREQKLSRGQTRAHYIAIDRRHTVLLAGRVNCPVVGHPLIHVDELRHEARYFAFHDRAVSSDHVLVLGLGDVELRNDCRGASDELTLWNAIEKFTVCLVSSNIWQFV